MEKSGELANFISIDDVIRKVWRQQSKNGHEVWKIMELYDINLLEPEEKLLDKHKAHIIWAGRFPFPKRPASKIYKLSGNDKIVMEGLFTRFKQEME